MEGNGDGDGDGDGSSSDGRWLVSMVIPNGVSVSATSVANLI